MDIWDLYLTDETIESTAISSIAGDESASEFTLGGGRVLGDACKVVVEEMSFRNLAQELSERRLGDIQSDPSRERCLSEEW